ncbi:1-deoxy-D-xylulose-5-phosphate synthase [Slackia heliotrinireducens]|uniref:1-deoxy-D-xylulose-5-phosphate synthase n=1 Tax=Slackia heliotrinireducens TaxID=84110 RepID=UPI0033145E7F
MARILDMISSPADLKVLTDDELAILASEIREQMISTTSRTGGHLAPSLGVVELVLACHSVLNCPKDKLVFDVGHQSYAHKLVTGRLERFDTLRTFGGISGFTKPNESEYDQHPSGHASDSLSVALGLAMARDLRGSDEKIVSIIGDAALSGGMAFEALNQIGQVQTPMVVILNDNEMSIAKNVGALSSYLGRSRTSRSYTQTRDNIQSKLESTGRLGRGLVDVLRNMKDSIKQFIIPNEMLFEQLGLVCTAPLDGHNIPELKRTLEAVLESDVPVLMHVVTKKGAGYEPAEKNPEKFHGIAPFDIATGEVKSSGGGAPKYTSVFSQALLKEAEANQDIVAITAAMSSGTGLDAFAKQFPERFIDVGIAEEHAVGLASGLALGGKLPVVAIYSTFMQRAIDQLIINNALANTHAVFCLDRGGLVGDDGPTHHGMFDLTYTRMIPNMKVVAPSNEAQLVNGLHTALHLDGPVTLRYPRGEARGVEVPDEPEMLEVGKSITTREGDDVAILAFGRMVQEAEAAADMLAEESISVRVVDMLWVKPMDEEAICKASLETKLVVTVEDNILAGGAGSGVMEVLTRRLVPSDRRPLFVMLGIPDEFVPQGKVPQLYHMLGIDAEGIADTVRRQLAAL